MELSFNRGYIYFYIFYFIYYFNLMEKALQIFPSLHYLCLSVAPPHRCSFYNSIALRGPHPHPLLSEFFQSTQSAKRVPPLLSSPQLSPGLASAKILEDANGSCRIQIQ